MIVAITSPQPHIHPRRGPKAFTVQVNEVPQSGTALLSSRYAKATSSIGRNPARNTAGICTPTSPAVDPRVEVRQYTGATVEMPRTALPIRPTEFPPRPFSRTPPSAGVLPRTVSPACGRASS